MTNESGKKEYDYKGHKVRIQAEERPATVFRADLWIDGKRTEQGDYEPKPTRSGNIKDAINYTDQVARRIIDKRKGTVGQQLTRAVQLAKKHKLTNPRACIRCNDPDEIVNKPIGDDLRGLEVWITDHDGYIEGIVGDHEDGRKNVAFALPD